MHTDHSLIWNNQNALPVAGIVMTLPQGHGGFQNGFDNKRYVIYFAPPTPGGAFFCLLFEQLLQGAGECARIGRIDRCCAAL